MSINIIHNISPTFSLESFDLQLVLFNCVILNANQSVTLTESPVSVAKLSSQICDFPLKDLDGSQGSHLVPYNIACGVMIIFSPSESKKPRKKQRQLATVSPR